MTIKMLIVDDEPIICRGLRETIPWDSIGVEVVGEAADGAEALELIKRQPVDLVLTDINMDGMDGLVLSKTLRERHSEIRIIILSGYDDFEYARQAIRIGVEDYLLKPVNVDELMGMVQRIGGELEQEANQRKEAVRDCWLSWLKSLMQNGGALPDGEKTPSVPAGAHSFRFVASQLEDYAMWAEQSAEEERQTVRRKWEQAVHNALSEEGQEVFSFFHHPNLLISLCIDSREVSREKLLAALGEVPGPAVEAHSLHFGVSPDFQALTEAYTRCENAIAAVQLSAAMEGRTVLFHEESVSPRRNRGLFAPAELEKELVNLLFNGSIDELEDVLGKMMDQSREKGNLLADIVQAVKELKVVIQRRLRTSSVDVSDEIEGFLAGEIDLHVHNSYRALEALIRRELLSLFTLIHSSVGGKNHWTIDRVKKYIESHYTNDLRASEVAAWLKITPNYFSIVFNQYFGKGFAEYLNEVRIEHAKAFLRETHDRVFEIAEKVGYKDYKYFCSIFKSYTGVTPTQYRKLAETTPT
ncbi:response regulator transcription factor [Paenibacillus radicis (ex Xue et al. 2023)]|uniref:Response regulator transcription factor n=1 Tax=Paenibacillus radicis (ex Xue et al. 2023) TaxID=2972489 RepID=A0ABT1YQU3_9BACL|nr:response regulator transcription factor [Paenibacillus radicis (ex Xue et al. 2023)]MCR8634350.1 response regulator transcription factor [Paenibacillus radicis (ex Xue et al. 2023)]